MGLLNLQVSESQLKNHVLFELEKLLNKNSTSLLHHNLSMPNRIMFEEINNRLLTEELNYDVEILQQEHQELVDRLNEEQKEVYNAVLDAVNEDKGGFLFAYGHGGMGKTYLWKAIVSKIRSDGQVVLTVVSSGIAHSRFKIPI